MTTTVQTILGLLLVGAVVGLAIVDQRVAPPMLAPVGDTSSRKGCDVDAPEPLKAAARKWCADGLFSKAAVTGDAKNVIAVMQFTPNGAQTWELQSGLLMGEFRGLTDQLAAAAPGKDISVALHDAADRRVGACARAITDKASRCGNK